MRSARRRAGKPTAIGHEPKLNSVDFTRYGVGVLPRGRAIFFFSFFEESLLLLLLDKVDDELALLSRGPISIFEPIFKVWFFTPKYAFDPS